MHTLFRRRWVLLTSLAGCAGLATTTFAGEPCSLLQVAYAGDVQTSNDPKSAENVQTNYLIKLLETSSQFRVRAQAAISLGLIEKSRAARDALTAALQDAHPAVRAAAATSLGRIGNSKNLIALRKLADDVEEPVRNAARASIGRLETIIEEIPVVPAIAATTAALSVPTSAHRM